MPSCQIYIIIGIAEEYLQLDPHMNQTSHPHTISSRYCGSFLLIISIGTRKHTLITSCVKVAKSSMWLCNPQPGLLCTPQPELWYIRTGTWWTGYYILYPISYTSCNQSYLPPVYALFKTANVLPHTVADIGMLKLWDGAFGISLLTLCFAKT